MFSIEFGEYYDEDEIHYTVLLHHVVEYINVFADVGCIDTHPSNGIFLLEWSPKIVTLACGKYEDGRGGTITVSIPSTPTLMESFLAALLLWKDKFVP